MSTGKTRVETEEKPAYPHGLQPMWIGGFLFCHNLVQRLPGKRGDSLVIGMQYKPSIYHIEN